MLTEPNAQVGERLGAATVPYVYILVTYTVPDARSFHQRVFR